MKMIGITGPTGAGKTTALEVLRELGAEVINADALYHRLLAEDARLKSALTGAFGPEILDEAGRIDRRRLSGAVYPHRLEELNGLTHPVIAAAVDERLDKARRAGRIAAAIDAIALIESGLADRCGVVVSILAPPEVRLERIMARDGIEEGYARRRMAAQPPDRFFVEHSDYVLVNRQDDTPQTFAARALVLLEALVRERGGDIPVSLPAYERSF